MRTANDRNDFSGTHRAARRRRLRAGVLWLSLLLCPISAGLWIRASTWQDTFGWAGWKDEPAGIWDGRGVALTRGSIVGYVYSGTIRFDNPLGLEPNANMQPHFIHAAEPTDHRWGGEFRAVYRELGEPTVFCRAYFLAIPLWLPTILLALAPAWRTASVFSRIKRRRPRVGQCRSCCYDLTGNASGRCPECGTPIAVVHFNSASAFASASL